MSPNEKKIEPPVWIKKILEIWLDARILEACLGDLEEKFRIKLENKTAPWKARALYIIEGLGFLKMAKRHKTISIQTTINMISHTLHFFIRLIKKDKSYYLVSMLGLTLSLGSFLLITMYIYDELAYDTMHENRDRIFRVSTHIRLNDVDYNQATSQFPTGPALHAEIPEVEEAVRIFPQQLTLESGDKKFQEQVIFADENFFKVFSFPLLLGDLNSSMEEPASVILTSAASKRYFGLENPLGKNILINGQLLTVSGVLQNVPDQSHLHFDAIIPLTLQLNNWKSQTGVEGRENKWFWTGAYTYILLKDAADEEKVRRKLPAIVDKYWPERYKAQGRFDLQPLTDIHLKSDLDAELEPAGSILYLRLFSVVAFVIVIISAINLVNLSYFKISTRIREMGIRKFLGQNTARIIAQLSLESILLGVLAFVLAIILCRFFISGFNLLVQKNLSLQALPNLVIAACTLLMIILICVVAVIRPAFRYASQSASNLLLRNQHNTSNVKFRNMLIGLQVCISFVLLVFSFIISSQIDFFKNKDIGFDKKNIVIVPLKADMYEKLEAFKNTLKNNKEVTDVAGGSIPGEEHNAWRFVPEGGSYEKPLMFPYAFADYNFLNTLGIKLVQGKNFEPDDKYDSLLPYIINKRAALELGWIDDPLNKTIEIFAPGTTEIMAKGIVIGVIENYHFESLHRPVKPLVLTVSPYTNQAIIKVSGDINQSTIAGIEATWKKFSAEPFEYEVLDNRLEKFYVRETRLSNVILFFTVIALYLTCYGLFAMSSLLFSSRLKEVTIRKVFGADQLTIIKQLYSRYAFFNIVAITAGLPISIWLGNVWLQTFQYRIDLTPDFFVKAALYILAAGLLSVSYYLGKVAFSNPIRFLRHE